MNVLLLVVLGLTSVYTTHAYVYVQVQKGDTKDMSNVDALIHKQVPSENVGEIAHQLKDTFSKKKLNKAKYKRFEVRKRADEEKANSKEEIKASHEISKNNLENVVLAVDTGASPEPPSKTTGTGLDIIDKLLNAVKEFGKDNKSPFYNRAREEYNIKPEVVNFRSGKPSLKFELNSETILKFAKELLSSPTVRRYADLLAQKAAVVFKTIKEDLKD